jgi:hypothetical protein
MRVAQVVPPKRQWRRDLWRYRSCDLLLDRESHQARTRPVMMFASGDSETRPLGADLPAGIAPRSGLPEGHPAHQM